MDLEYVKPRAIKPVLAGYIIEAQALLRQSPVPDEKAVHDIRVLMKKCRAVMRLIASQIDSKSFQRDYEAFREAGRLLTVMRESSVHRKTLRELKKNHQDTFKILLHNQKIEALMRKEELPAATKPEEQTDIKKIEDLLDKAGFRLRFMKLDGINTEQLITELGNSYKTVALKYLDCRNNPKPSNLHQFRKKSKDFLYQLWFFRPLNPAMIKPVEKKLDAMTQNLGKYNDLAQLIKALEYKYPSDNSSPAMDELIILVRQAQDNYLSKVWPVAYKVFCPGMELKNVTGYTLPAKGSEHIAL